MNLVDLFNTLIVKINKITCSIKNTQSYIGKEGETDITTLTGRIAELENLLDENGLIKCDKMNPGCTNTWPDVTIEWD